MYFDGYYTSAHFTGPDALCFGIIHLSVQNLVNVITPEYMKGISLNWVEVLTMKWQLTDYILGFTAPRVGSPQDQTWPWIQFWSHNSIQMYQVATFVNGMTYWGSLKHRWKF